MSDQDNFGFGNFVPGFDFLQNLAKGAAQNFPQLPNLANWVAPTLNVEELEKRITELKAVHFWLDQNGKALSATIQALEVQKMTLATLKGMNFNMGEVASALTARATDTMLGSMQRASETAAHAAGAMADAAQPSAKPKSKSARAETSGQTEHGEAASGIVDPLQWWGALTQQFQEIAANAMKDVTDKTVSDTRRNIAQGMAKDAAKAAGSAPPSRSTSKKAAPRKQATPRKRASRGSM